MEIKPGTVISIALIGGIAYIAYKFLKGDWKLPAFDIFKGIGEGFDVGGLPGAVGGGIVEFLTPGETTLRERRDIIFSDKPKLTQTIIEETGLKEKDIDINMLKEKADVIAGAQVTKEIAEGLLAPFYWLLPGIAPGLGLAVGEQQTQYLATLPQRARESAELKEYEQRKAFLETGWGQVLNILGWGIPSKLTETVWAPNLSEETIERAKKQANVEFYVAEQNIQKRMSEGENWLKVAKEETKQAKARTLDIAVRGPTGQGVTPTPENAPGVAVKKIGESEKQVTDRILKETGLIRSSMMSGFIKSKGGI